MSVDVRERLDRLAQQAPAGSPPSDLWQRGVRRRRRRLAGGVSAALLAVVAGGGLAGTVARSVPLDPAPAATGSVAIPSRLVEPSPWTPGTDRLGPPGRLAVVIGAARSTGLLGTQRDGLVGVSATTGGYRFLDLPGRLSPDGSLLDEAATVALSPEGRSVAYWRGDETARGVAVYDTVTGKVRTERLPSRQGLAPQTLAWVGEETLLLSYGVITQRDASSMSTTLGPARLWSPADGPSMELDTTASESISGVARTDDGFSTWDGDTLGVWTAAKDPLYTRREVRVLQLGEQASLGDALLGPDAAHVAVIAGDGPEGRRALHVGALRPADRTAVVRALDLAGSGRRVDVRSLVGWQDADHVLVDATVRARSGVYAVDVRDGSAQRVVATPSFTYAPGRLYASALWSTPVADRPAPTPVLNPRLVAAGGGLLVLLLVAGGGVLLRRRRGLR